MVLCSNASADVNLAYSGSNLGSTTSTMRNDTSSYQNVWTGASSLSENGGAAFMAYCIDPRTSAGFPNSYSTTNLDSFFGVNASSHAEYLTSGYGQQLQRSGYSTDMAGKNTQANALVVRNNLDELFSYAYADSLLSATNAAAFGLAVWEIIMQDGAAFSRTTGEIRTRTTDTPAGVITKLTSYLGALSASSLQEQATWASAASGPRKSYTYTVYFDTTDPFKQNFIRATENHVPVPGSLALAGLALAGVVVVRRRKA